MIYIPATTLEEIHMFTSEQWKRCFSKVNIKFQHCKWAIFLTTKTLSMFPLQDFSSLLSWSTGTANDVQFNLFCNMPHKHAAFLTSFKSKHPSWVKFSDLVVFRVFGFYIKIKPNRRSLLKTDLHWCPPHHQWKDKLKGQVCFPAGENLIFYVQIKEIPVYKWI